ncbi:hypothetical protein F5Y11DRAFT_225784 [Daldinia sp. FL1419]|nr:hypothetical protein F5Y11DRAFT_225784 [Daldinia sp. FL1419]
MAASQLGPVHMDYRGGSSEEVSSTSSFLGELTSVRGTERLARRLDDFANRIFDRISAESSGVTLTDEDYRRFREYEKDLDALLMAFGSLPGDDLTFSLQPRVVKGSKKVVIGCKGGNVRRMIERAIKRPGPLALVHKRMGFEGIEINEVFLGRATKFGPPSTSMYSTIEFTTVSSLGSRLRIYDLQGTNSISTIGGVILLDGKPYGLTTGHAVPSNLRRKEWEEENSEALNIANKQVGEQPEYELSKVLSGRIVAHRYPDARSIQEHVWQQQPRARRQMDSETLEDSPTNNPRMFEPLYLSQTTDWALVEILGDNIPPNAVPKWDRTWAGLNTETATKEIMRGHLIRKPISEANLARLMRYEKSGVGCLIFTYSPDPVVGLIAAGAASVVLNGAIFSVLRIYMDAPLDYGDSGSWVVIGNAVCGIIIAADQKDPYFNNSEPGTSSCHESQNTEIFSAYMIPMVDILDSISKTLSVNVSFPSFVDYRIDTLRARQQSLGWTQHESEVSFREYLDMELLLGQQKKQKWRDNEMENLNLYVGSKVNGPVPISLLPLKPKWFSRSLVESLIGLKYETIYQLLQLGEICPLSAAIRPSLRQWARSYRKFRFQNRRTFVCNILTKEYLQTEAGENLLGLLITLWKALRQSSHGKQADGSDNKSRCIAWLAQLLSSLLSIMNIPKALIPSTQQLQIFVYCIVAAFKDKDLKHLYLSLDPNYLIKSARPTDVAWPALPPLHLATIHKAWRVVSEWISGRSDNDSLLNANNALAQFQSEGSTEWNQTVLSTSRILVLLERIYQDSKNHMLVYSGQSAPWVGFYAAAVLGLNVQFREKHESGSNEIRSPYTGSEGRFTLVDVVVYLWDEEICEIIDRESVKPLPKEISFSDPPYEAQHAKKDHSKHSIMRRLAIKGLPKSRGQSRDPDIELGV